MTSDGGITFTLRAAQEKLGLSRAVLTGLMAAGFVTPSRGARQAYRFTFQDLALLRTAHALQQSGIAPRKILKALATLKAALPDELPLTGLRITAVGADVAVRDRHGALEATSGQLLMDFDVASRGASVAFLDRRGPQPAAAAPDPGAHARAVLQRGQAQEAAGDTAGAEASYREVIEVAPALVFAFLNLGALLGESGRSAEAVALYDLAAIRHPEVETIWFNRGIALEDQQRHADAVASYERALALDADFADAHFNLGRLLELDGNLQAALRHFSAYRRLRS